MSTIVTHLPHNIEAFSLTNAHIGSIGEHLINALNVIGKLGKIYKGLIQYILAKYGGAQNITCISHHDCTKSPITCTLFLL